MKELFELHQLITGIGYPIFYLVMTVFYVFAVVNTPYRSEFSALAASGCLSLFVDTMFIFLQISSQMGWVLFSDQTTRTIWILQSAAQYLAVFFFVAGMLLLILKLRVKKELI